MTPTLVALMGYVLLTIALVLTVVSHRSLLVLGGKKRADEFPRGRTFEQPPLIERIHNAHQNCVENLPLAAAVMLAAVASGQTAVTDPLSIAFLAARFGQSGVHVIAVNHWMVMLRVTFYLVQIAILVYWALALLGAI